MLHQNTHSFNSDPNEISKFSQWHEDWWNPTGKLKTLHQINPVRLSYIYEKIKIKEKHVLDIGCGGGILSESLAQKGAFVTGIDLNKDALAAALAHQQL